MHGLGAAIQMAVANDLADRANLLRLVARIHRQIGMVPIAENAETLEAGALQVDLRGREGAAGRSKGGGIELLPGLAVLLFDRQLDRQAVTVPAGQ